MNTIERYRGDTAPDQFTLGEDITGSTFKMTVNTEQNPVDQTTQLFQVIGDITDAVAGEFEFRLTSTDADQDPGSYFYDVERTDASGYIKTVDKGKYKFLQDITKT